MKYIRVILILFLSLLYNCRTSFSPLPAALPVLVYDNTLINENNVVMLPATLLDTTNDLELRIENRGNTPLYFQQNPLQISGICFLLTDQINISVLKPLESYSFSISFHPDNEANYYAGITINTSNKAFLFYLNARGITSETASYYSGTENMTGTELKNILHAIIKDHTVIPYTDDNSPDVWDALKNCDEDPLKSTNVILIYTRRSQDKSLQDTGTGYDGWNREHVWPKSHGFPDESWVSYTDIHALRACDKSINSTRSNKDFDDGGIQVKDYHDAENYTITDCYTDSDSFEPPDEIKGDVARAIFYMAVRYEGDSANEPDLEIVDYTDSSDSYFGKLSTLIEWHLEDPVSSEEITRNEKVYSTWQHNRNPFVDYPEWVTKIW